VPLYLVIASAFVAGLLDARRRVPRGADPAAAVWLKRVLAATLVLYAVQATYSEDFSNAVENAGFFLVPFAVLFCLLSEVRWTRANLTAVTWAVGIVGAVVAAIGIGQYLSRDLILNQQLLESNQLKPVFRVNSVFFDPNVFGRYLALGVIALSAAVAWSRGGRSAYLATAVGVLMLAGLVLSFSITSVAALLAGMGLLAIVRYAVPGAVAVVAAIVLTGAVFAFTGGADRSDIGPTRGIDEETSGRIDLIKGGWELVKEEPLAGWGSGAFGRAYFDQIRETETTTSHSEPLTVAAEQGVPGFLVYLGLLGTMAWVLLGAGVGSSAARAAVAAGIAALVVHSLGYAGFLSDPATWALLAVAVALRREPGPG
jgi:O-antigen ligase